MLIIDTGCTDPFFNLAAEEYLFREYDAGIFMVYINTASVIIGKHQNPSEEINIKCLRENDIPVIRRVSGGGTVYHDTGNINYTIINNHPAGKKIDFTGYTKTLLSFLEEHGVKAYRGEKNEIRTEGMKISGNAEHVFKSRVLHHGTLLYSANLEMMSDCLAQPEAVIKSRAVRSNRTSVSNLKERIKGVKDAEDLKDLLKEYVLRSEPGSEYYDLNNNEITRINRLKYDKFMTWEWNFAYGPEYTVSNVVRVNDLNVDVEIKVSRGIITDCSIRGTGDWTRLQSLLKGKRHRYEDIEQTLESLLLATDSDTVYGFLM